jgi:hypothetical protein
MYPITTSQAEALLLKGNYPFTLQNGQYVRVGTLGKAASNGKAPAAVVNSLKGKTALFAGPNDYQGLQSGAFPLPK